MATTLLISNVIPATQMIRRESVESVDSFADYDRDLIDLTMFASASHDCLNFDDHSSISADSDESTTADRSLSSFNGDELEEEDEAEHDSSAMLSFELPPGTDNEMKKRVRFGGVTVREYSVTVGALTAAKDSCPFQLSWEHSQDITAKLPGDPTSPVPLRRLSLNERRLRIAQVQGLNLNQVLGLEFKNVKQSVQDTMVSVNRTSKHSRPRTKMSRAA